jgi:hypothetical protein
MITIIIGIASIIITIIIIITITIITPSPRYIKQSVRGDFNSWADPNDGGCSDAPGNNTGFDL